MPAPADGEDNELNREIAVTLLEEQGAAITTAENGREAVELFQNAPQGTFDAVLMDVMMPEMNAAWRPPAPSAPSSIARRRAASPLLP